MKDLKQAYKAIALGFLILLVLYIIAFVTIRIYKGTPLFDSVAIPISLSISFIVLLVGCGIAFYLSLKK